MSGIFVIPALCVIAGFACWYCERKMDLMPPKEERQLGHLLNEATRGNLTTLRAQYAEIGYYPAARRWRV